MNDMFSLPLLCAEQGEGADEGAGEGDEGARVSVQQRSPVHLPQRVRHHSLLRLQQEHHRQRSAQLPE